MPKVFKLILDLIDITMIVSYVVNPIVNLQVCTSCLHPFRVELGIVCDSPHSDTFRIR